MLQFDVVCTEPGPEIGDPLGGGFCCRFGLREDAGGRKRFRVSIGALRGWFLGPEASYEYFHKDILFNMMIYP